MGSPMNSVVQDVRSFGSGALHLIRTNALTLALLAAALVFVMLLEDVAEGEIMRLDVLAYWFFVQTLRSDVVTPVMEGFTSLSSVAVVAVMTLVVAALAPGKAPGWCVTVNIGGAGVLNILLKNIIQRPRPDGFRLVAESGYSFPSGHSMISMAFFGLVIWMVWHYHEDDVMRYVWCAVFGLIIALVGISRIYLGVHYASDVIAGFCVSIIWLVFYTKIIAPLFMPDLPVRKSAQKQISPSP